MDAGRVFGFGKKLATQLMRDDVMGLSAELSYRMLFAIFPFFIFLGALSGFVTSALNIDDPSQRVVDEIGNALPDDAASVLETQLEGVMGSQSGGLLSFGVLLALWAASGATNTAVKAMNRAYNVEEARPFYKKYPVVLGITLLFAVAIVAAFATLFAVQLFGGRIAEYVGLGEEFAFVVYIAQIPVALLFLVLGVSFLYWAGPNTKRPYRWITPGAVLFVLTWLIATVGFAFYIANFGNYNATYGALAGIIILMLWFYITSIALLVGAEFNAVLEEETGAVPATESSDDTVRSEARLEEERRSERRKRPAPLPPGRSPGEVAKDQPVSAGFGAVVAGILLARLAKQQ